MRRAPKGYVYGFYNLRQSWHGKLAARGERTPVGGVVDELMIGLYSPEGARSEFAVRWRNFNPPSPRLEAWHDSWKVLADMPELIKLMGAKGDCRDSGPTCDEFAQVLLDLGFKDLTERRKPRQKKVRG